MWSDLDLEQLDKESYSSLAYYTKEEIEELIVMIRLNLYNNMKLCGSKKIQEELDDTCVVPLPSLSTIGRVLRKRGLTYKRTGNYNE